MSIHDPQRYLRNIWDWKILEGCFGQTNIEPTDIDGFVERNGRFLFLETKEPGVAIPYGQKRTFDALTAHAIEVITIWGPTNTPQKMSVWPDIPKPVTLEEFRREVSMWFWRADTGRLL